MGAPVAAAAATRACALCVLALAFAVPTVRADRASGTWTGNVELRGNYYWERSTRVVSPTLGGSLESPDGIRLHGDYVVDSITSASQAAGVIEDIRFTEIRHEGSLGMGYEFNLGGADLSLDASFRVSREPDYVSIGGGINSALSLNDRSTVLRFGVYVLHDEIRQRLRAGGGARPMTDGGTSAGGFNESFNALALSVGWEQLLGPSVYAQLTYQYGYLNGFLANAYRRVVVADVLRPESHPGTRHRHTVTGRLAGHIRATRSSVHLIYRAYLDSWDIAALTPEIRIYQELADFLHLRVRWRHYRQRRSFFYSEAYPQDTPDEAFVTADPKMSTFHSNLLGFQLLLGADFLSDTALDVFRRATFDITFEYIWNTNRFGNGLIAQAGLRVPF
ncbi:MAG: DUF3570 domain-containing protein [Myxococcota bacterium]